MARHQSAALAPEFVQGVEQLGYGASRAPSQQPPPSDDTHGRAQRQDDQRQTSGDDAERERPDPIGVVERNGRGESERGDHDHPGEIAEAAQHHRCGRGHPFLGRLGQRGGPDEISADRARERGVEDITPELEMQAPAVGAGDTVRRGQSVPLPDGEQDGDYRDGIARRPGRRGWQWPGRGRRPRTRSCGR